MEEKLEQIRAREEELFASLWKKLGEEGLKELGEVLMPLATYTPEEGYSLGFTENFPIDTLSAEMVDKEMFARRKTVQRVSGTLKRIYQVGFPPVVEKKKKKDKPTFK